MSGAAPELAAVRMRPEHMPLDLTRLEGDHVNMSPARPLAPALARSALAVTITWLCLAAVSPGVGAPPEEASGAGAHYDVVISGGTVYDGSGSPPFVGDVALKGDRIVYVGPLAPGSASERVEARGKAVAPGFINMLAHPEESLIADGRALSDLRQGVTLEVLGEDSMGPLTPEMKRHARERQADIHYTVDWTTLGEYLHKLERHGIAPNVASFVGAGTVRTNVLGERDVQPTAAQLERMRTLVRQAMEEGALGVTTALIYSPNQYARTPELMGRAGGDLSPEGRGQRKLGQARRAHPRGRGCARRRGPHHRGYVRVHGGCDGARCRHASVGAGRRPRGLDRPVAGSGGSRARARRDARPGPAVGEPLRSRGRRRHAAARVQEPAAQAADGQDARRGREDAWRECRGRRHRPCDPGRIARSGGLLSDVGGERAPRVGAPLGQLRLGCGCAGARGGVSEIQPASAHLRQLRAAAREIRP